MWHPLMILPDAARRGEGESDAARATGTIFVRSICARTAKSPTRAASPWPPGLNRRLAGQRIWRSTRNFHAHQIANGMAALDYHRLQPGRFAD